MTRDHGNAGRAKGKLLAALASGVLALAVSGAALACTPTMPCKGGSEDHHHDNSGSGGGNDAAIQDAGQRAKDKADAGVNQGGSGITSGGGGQGGEALGGNIANLGATQQANELAEKADKLGLTGDDRANFIDLMKNPITRAMLESEIEEARAKAEQKRKEQEEALFWAILAAKAQQAEEEAKKRKSQEDMMNLLDLATEKGKGKSNLQIVTEKAGDQLRNLVPPGWPGGNAAQGGAPAKPPPATPSAGARTPPASIMTVDSPQPPNNSGPLGDARVSPTAVPPGNTPPATGWVDLPPDPSIGGTPAATSASTAKSDTTTPDTTPPADPTPKPTPAANPQPASPPADELDDWIRQNEKRQDVLK